MSKTRATVVRPNGKKDYVTPNGAQHKRNGAQGKQGRRERAVERMQALTKFSAECAVTLVNTKKNLER